MLIKEKTGVVCDDYYNCKRQKKRKSLRYQGCLLASPV